MGIIRKSMVYLNKHSFNLLCKSLVRPRLEYGNVVWSPFLKSDITLIENVQRRATRFFFFYQGFLSRTLTTHRTAGEGRGPFFIPLNHFKPLTNIQTFMCNFTREMTIAYF